MTEGVTAITPTGGRAEAVTLCEAYVRAQTYRGPFQWLVIDDCDPQTVYPALRPEPKWRLGQNTLSRNILAALPEIQYDKILILEDDDCYPSGYVEEMSNLLVDSYIAGCERSYYYHAVMRRYKTFYHPGRASFCSTGFRHELLPALKSACEDSSPSYLDIKFWERASGQGARGRFTPKPLCIGIKGLPGRPGIGIGHRPQDGDGWTRDADLSVLKSWVGKDWENYKEWL